MRPPFLPVLIGTGFGSGFSPFAPGTAGALLASALWVALYFLLPFQLLLWVTVGLILLFNVAGIWAADRLEPYWGEDPSRVVVDEMVGVWLSLLAVPNTGYWYWYALGAFAWF
ncbi:MAG: phosphatidylglycerophosphatase A, partial [Mediterranea sp.]|nr:phosphatidylglycerophosphatase A [Mediterranea sp.]